MNFKKQKQKIKEYNKDKQTITEFFNKTYPGWEKSKDANHIKMQIEKRASIIAKYKIMQKTITIHKDEWILSKFDLSLNDWPFKSDEITICKYGKLWITCFIDGKEYALNGLAKETMPYLQFVHDAGKAIKGKDIGPFIKIGKNLWI